MATPSFNFKAEYAKSARSSCNQCGNTIEKDELRLAEMVQVRHSAISWNVHPHHFCRRQILMERCDSNSELLQYMCACAYRSRGGTTSSVFLLAVNSQYRMSMK